ncbi:MAG: SRPBCC family protein [Woeseia sp.]
MRRDRFPDNRVMLSARRKLILGLCAAMVGTAAMTSVGAELRSISVSLEAGRYHLNSVTLIHASQDDLYAVLTDYDLFKKFTSAIVASNDVEPDTEGRPRFHTRMEGCVLFWCSTFVRNGYLLLAPKHDIVAIADPEQSDFEYSRERWRLSSEANGTLMIYDFEMEPRFWVPPVIGPYLIKRALKGGGIRAVNRIELLARGEEPAF